jgi:tape measure domain-containing protein
VAEVKVTVTAADRTGTALSSIRKRTKGAAQSFRSLGSSITGARSATLDFLKALVGFAALQKATELVRGLADSFVTVNSQAEDLTTILDKLIGEAGAGAAKFRELADTAIDMGANVGSLVSAFVKMRTQGIKPTNDQMRTLIDTVAAMGGSEEVLEGVSTALGQIQAKGKVSSEELLQLAERGLPVYEILREELNLTAEQVSNIGNMSVSTSKTIDAIFKGLEKRFAGTAESMKGNFSGIVKEIKSLWEEFLRVVGESGAFDAVKNVLSDIRDSMRQAFKTGDAKEWARDISLAVKVASEAVGELVAFTGQLIREFARAASKAGVFNDIREWLSEISAEFKAGVADEWVASIVSAIKRVSVALRVLAPFAVKVLEGFAEIAKIAGMADEAIVKVAGALGKASVRLEAFVNKIDFFEGLQKISDGFEAIAGAAGRVSVPLENFIRKFKPIEKLESVIVSVVNAIRSLAGAFGAASVPIEEFGRKAIDWLVGPRGVQGALQNTASDAQNVKASIDDIPDVSKKTVVVEYKTKASPEMPFSQGIDEIKRKMDSLPTETKHVVNLSFSPTGAAIRSEIDSLSTSIIDMLDKIDTGISNLAESGRKSIRNFAAKARTDFNLVARQAETSLQFGFRAGLKLVEQQLKSIGARRTPTPLEVLMQRLQPGGGARFHSGGVIDSAPRMHSGGINQSERLIVAQTGEGVISRRGMSALNRINSGNVGGATVNIGDVVINGDMGGDPDAMARKIQERIARDIRFNRSPITGALA